MTCSKLTQPVSQNVNLYLQILAGKAIKRKENLWYLSGFALALVGSSEDVELSAAPRQGALVDVHSAQVYVNATGAPRDQKLIKTTFNLKRSIII